MGVGIFLDTICCGRMVGYNKKSAHHEGRRSGDYFNLTTPSEQMTSVAGTA